MVDVRYSQAEKVNAHRDLVGKPKGNKKVRRHRTRWVIAHETATFRNPQMHSFTGDGKNVTDPQQTKL